VGVRGGVGVGPACGVCPTLQEKRRQVLIDSSLENETPSQSPVWREADNPDSVSLASLESIAAEGRLSQDGLGTVTKSCHVESER
jgi:hypothetical protein